MISDDKFKKAREVFLAHGGLMSTGEALNSGIHPRDLYALRDSGQIEKIERGLYRLSDLPPLSNPDLVPIARKIPKGVICLISALHFHDLTTQLPHEVYVALPRNAEAPRLSYPPIRIFWFSGKAYSEGVDEHTIDDTLVKIYCIEKTIADCFKYRNKLGHDVALEVLKGYFSQGKRKVDRILYYAKICRVDRVMTPYIEALI